MLFLGIRNGGGAYRQMFGGCKMREAHVYTPQIGSAGVGSKSSKSLRRGGEFLIIKQ